MDDPDLCQVLKGLEHLGGNPAQQVGVERLKSWLLDVLVKIHVQEFKYNHEMVSKWKVV